MLTDAEVSAFAERSYRLLVNMARKRLGSCAADAEDVAQEALLALWQNRASAENALAYAGGCVAHLVAKRINRKKMESGEEVPGWDVEHGTALDELIERETAQVSAARRGAILSQLRPAHRNEWARWVAAGFLSSTQAERCSNSRMRRGIIAAAGVAALPVMRIQYGGKPIGRAR